MERHLVSREYHCCADSAEQQDLKTSAAKGRWWLLQLSLFAEIMSFCFRCQFYFATHSDLKLYIRNFCYMQLLTLF